MNKNLTLLCWPHRAVVLVGIICLSFASTMSLAASPNPLETTSLSASQNGRVSAASIASSIELLKARTDISDTDRDSALELLQAALARMESAANAQGAAAGYVESLNQAPKTIGLLRDELHTPSVDADEAKLESEDGSELQLRLAGLQTRVAQLRSQQRALEEDLRAMAARPAVAREELAALRRSAEQKPANLPASAAPALIEASRLRDEAARIEVSARIEKVEQELLSLPAREALTTVQRDLALRDLQQVDQSIAQVSAALAAIQAQQAEARVQAAEAMRIRLSDKPPYLQQYAEDTAKLRQDLTALNEAQELARNDQGALRTQLAELIEAKSNAEQIFQLNRVGEDYGRLLSNLRKDLPDLDALERRILKRDNSLVDSRLAQFQFGRRLRVLQETKKSARKLLIDADVPIEGDHLALMKELVTSRREALIDLQTAQAGLSESWSEANALESELLERSTQLQMLLDERLLWLPNAPAMGSVWVSQVLVGMVWLFKPSNWTEILPALRAAWSMRPFTLILLLATVIAIGWRRRRLMARFEPLAKPVGTRQDKFQLTLSTLLITFLIVLPVPLLIGTLGWSLRIVEDNGPFAQALGLGMLDASIVLFMLSGFYVMCRWHGLFIGQFQWDSEGTRRLSRALRLLGLALIPAAVVTGMADDAADPIISQGIGRLAFLAGSLSLALFLHRVFRPQGGALTGGLNRKALAWRTRAFWFWGLVAVPLALAVLAISGYYVTAEELQARLFTSGWIVLAIIIVYQIAMRGVSVASRRAAWQLADSRHQRAEEHAEAKAAAEASGEALPTLADDSELDAAAVSQQTRALLRAATGILLVGLLWSVWSGLIPALGVFNDIVLWSRMVTTSAGEIVEAVTLGQLLMGVLIFGLTALAARNLPGFLEIAVLQGAPIDGGTRYAIVTISRYLILGIGVIFAFNQIGADWSKLQWIVAALGVGLGFGLQEIVANFISGIIILFERPVRVGDVVTIGTTTGTVSRIKIRAITITDPDNFEVLVPNKAFITQPVQNWSLTSAVTRLVIKVGIGYESDIVKAQQVMLDVAMANAQVLTSPAPTVLFLGFGDSALNFELRVFTGRIEHRMPTLHALHMAMHAALKSAGIDIPFPQRDLHLHSASALVTLPTMPSP